MFCFFWVHSPLVQMSLDEYTELIPAATTLTQHFWMRLHISNIHRVREECKVRQGGKHRHPRSPKTVADHLTGGASLSSRMTDGLTLPLLSVIS